MNTDINPCCDPNTLTTCMTINPSNETVQNSTSDQLQTETHELSHYENVNL